MNQKKKVRLSDIAEKLGVSTVTVSKAMADKEGVGEELRKQIKDMALSMGYQVKKTALAFNGNENLTGNIGILIPNRFFGPNYSFYWYLFNFLSKELLQRNFYSIMELITDEDEENLVMPRMIQDAKVDGVIILGQVSNNYLDAFSSNYNNLLLLDFYTNKFDLDSVSSDDYHCSYMLTNYVISQGHKKLRFVGNFNSTTSITDRFMGFQKALLENGIESSVQDIIKDRDNKGTFTHIALPSKEDMPTAFICNNDATATTLIEELIANGYSVPGDISVTGFDNFVGPKEPPVGITTVYIKPEDTASIAADLIIKKIKGESYLKGRHLVGGTLLIRDSVKSI